MAGGTKASLDEQINRLMGHLEEEHPELLSVVQSFRRLDKIAYQLGLLDRSESYATQVTWWPLIAVLGTFSSGKSTFINNLLGKRLQATGNQAVDDKFTVICYGRDSTPRVLPGLALDSDPRFPLYRISGEIDEVLQGDGQRLDTYLQLKTCDSDQLRGKILIDSPGFDADEQRTSTLRITNQIIDVSDLVLVFFDARHPEPGAMRDTLEYLVAGTLQRADFNKFLYILNQIDNAAREDNPEQVFAAWQRALAQKGLMAGRFYQIYDPAAAVPIEDPGLRQRFEAKRAHDVDAIADRMRQLEVERSYRVAGKLERTAARIRDAIVPRLASARRAWKGRVMWLDAIVLGSLLVLALAASIGLGYWNGLRFEPPWRAALEANPLLSWAGVVAIALVLYLLHRLVRRLAGQSVQRDIRRDAALGEDADRVARAFGRNVTSWRPFFFAAPRGWSGRTRRKLDVVLDEAHAAVQRLNDRYTDPSGRGAPAAATAAAVETARERSAADDEAAEAAREAASNGGEWPAPVGKRSGLFGRRSSGSALEH